MRETIFSGRIPISCADEEISSSMKCDIVKTDEKIEIRIIDTRDLFSFYICSISSSEFYIIKREQDIRVDFDRFIRKLVEMFHNLTKNRLNAIFNRESSKFYFVEKDDFRNIVRFELKFNKPDEMHYKRYLSDVISRMESDNVKLLKENSLLKEQYRNEEREFREKIKYLESDYGENQRRIEKMYKENAVLIGECSEKGAELEKLKNKIITLEKETTNLNYELEKKKIQEVKNETLHVRVEELSKINQNLEKEIETANEIIKKIRNELKDLKKSYEEKTDEIKNLKSENSKIKKENEDLAKKMRINEEKLKANKEFIKEKESKIKDLEFDRAALSKKLEDAQCVSDFFYNKNVERHSPEVSENNSFYSSVQPESPPN